MSRHWWWAIWLAWLACPAAAGDDLWRQTTDDGRSRIRLHFFWTATCPHCTAARPFVEAMPQRLPWLVLDSRPLTGNLDNQRLFRHLVREFGGRGAVPAFVFCGRMVAGWDSAETTGAALEAALSGCHKRAEAGEPLVVADEGSAAQPVHLPGLGTIDPAGLSLPLLTLMLAGLDAFNPCAFFVLLFLLSMMAHQNSRGRMLAVGGIFVLVSGLMYFAFMAAWLNIFQLLGQLAGVTVAAGVVAVLVGMVNIKDFLAPDRGPSLSISDAGRRDVYRRGRAILAAGNLPAMLTAAVLLAVAANFYELLCTAGFPMVFTRLLTLHEPATGMRYLYLAAYNLIYVLPLAAIVAVVARNLAAHRLDERGVRLLKLLSGLMMAGLGLLLLVAPERTASAWSGAALVAASLALTWLGARFYRR